VCGVDPELTPHNFNDVTEWTLDRPPIAGPARSDEHRAMKSPNGFVSRWDLFGACGRQRFSGLESVGVFIGGRLMRQHSLQRLHPFAPFVALCHLGRFLGAVDGDLRFLHDSIVNGSFGHGAPPGRAIWPADINKLKGGWRDCDPCKIAAGYLNSRAIRRFAQKRRGLRGNGKSPLEMKNVGGRKGEGMWCRRR
jgi:hypothetical protein